jgi:hypothetical protein
MNVTNSVLRRMAIILKASKVNLFVSSVLFVFWYHSPNFLDTPPKMDLEEIGWERGGVFVLRGKLCIYGNTVMYIRFP